MKPLRLVLDTNVLVSALVLATKHMLWLRNALQERRVLPLASGATIAEFKRVLTYSYFDLENEEQEILLNQYRSWCEIVVVPDLLDLPDCRDPDDRKFLALALAGRADALVTGDNDLLELAGDFAIPILQPAGLRQQWPNLFPLPDMSSPGTGRRTDFEARWSSTAMARHILRAPCTLPGGRRGARARLHRADPLLIYKRALPPPGFRGREETHARR